MGSITQLGTFGYHAFVFPSKIKPFGASKTGKFIADCFNQNNTPKSYTYTLIGEKRVPFFVLKALGHQKGITLNPFDYFFGKDDKTPRTYPFLKSKKGTIPRKTQSIKRRVVDAFVLGPLVGLVEAIFSIAHTALAITRAILRPTIGSLLDVLHKRDPRKYSLLSARTALLEAGEGIHAVINSCLQIVPGIGQFLACGCDFTKSLARAGIKSLSSIGSKSPSKARSKSLKSTSPRLPKQFQSIFKAKRFVNVFDVQTMKYTSVQVDEKGLRVQVDEKRPRVVK